MVRQLFGIAGPPHPRVGIRHNHVSDSPLTSRPKPRAWCGTTRCRTDSRLERLYRKMECRKERNPAATSCFLVILLIRRHQGGAGKMKGDRVIQGVEQMVTEIKG